MSWRIIDESDLASAISQREIDVFRKDGAVDGSDPVDRLLASTAGFVRAYVASNGSVRLAPDPRSLPDALIGPAMALAAYDVLKRFPVEVGQDRKAARDEAMRILDLVREAKLNVESYGASDADQTGGSAIEVVTSSRHRATSAAMEGW